MKMSIARAILKNAKKINNYGVTKSAIKDA